MQAWIKQMDCGDLFQVKTEDDAVWCVTDDFYYAAQFCGTIQYFLDTCESLRMEIEKQKSVILLTDIVP